MSMAIHALSGSPGYTSTAYGRSFTSPGIPVVVSLLEETGKLVQTRIPKRC